MYFQNEFYKKQCCAILVKNLILTTKYFFSWKNFFCSGLWNFYFCLNWLVVLTWNQNFLKQTKTLIEGKIGAMWLTLQGPLRWGTPAPPSGPRAHPARRSSCQDLMGHRTRDNYYTRTFWRFSWAKFYISNIKQETITTEEASEDFHGKALSNAEQKGTLKQIWILRSWCIPSSWGQVYSPYHLASSSLMSGEEDDTGTGFGFWAGFLLKRETIFWAPAVGVAVA